MHSAVRGMYRNILGTPILGVSRNLHAVFWFLLLDFADTSPAVVKVKRACVRHMEEWASQHKVTQLFQLLQRVSSVAQLLVSHRMMYVPFALTVASSHRKGQS